MKDLGKKIAGYVASVALGALVTIYINDRRHPDLRLFLEGPIDLATERVTVLRLRNLGGGSALDAEVRLSPKIPVSDVSLVSAYPPATISGSPVLITVPKLKPKDSVVLFYREPKGSSFRPKEMIDGAVYDQGQVSVSSGDELLENYVWQKQAMAFLYGAAAMMGVLLFSAWLVELLQKKSTATATTATTSETINKIEAEVEKVRSG